MQLSVVDVVKTFDGEIRKCTAISNNCRKIMYKTVFNNESLPPLYSKTRWGGIFEMLNHFFKQEDFFNELGQQHSELDLTEQWDFIKEYVAAFEPVYISTKAMQAKHTKNPGNRFVEPLTKALKNRLKNLKESIVFKAALLLDPRFNYLNSKFFNQEEKEEIRSFIISTSERIHLCKAKVQPSSSSSPSNAPNGTPNSSSDFDLYFTELYGGSLPEQNAEEIQTSANKILRQLISLDAEAHQNSHFDVWNFWLMRKSTHPELYEVAT
uniref:HAT C-terminal dimerisation domain-containing protein n=1 Tax=Anopheles arabiensis TaxID=7173 RepID=A0A182HUD4_ANOAR